MHTSTFLGVVPEPNIPQWLLFDIQIILIDKYGRRARGATTVVDDTYNLIPKSYLVNVSGGLYQLIRYIAEARGVFPSNLNYSTELKNFFTFTDKVYLVAVNPQLNRIQGRDFYSAEYKFDGTIRASYDSELGAVIKFAYLVSSVCVNGVFVNKIIDLISLCLGSIGVVRDIRIMICKIARVDILEHLKMLATCARDGSQYHFKDTELFDTVD
jgi:hypothetical protein